MKIKEMEAYTARKIEFKEVFEIYDWSIKIYTISKNGDFDHPKFYDLVKTKLPKWLSMENSFVTSNEKVGFLILHSGNEGIFSLINWWVGNNMLNTHIFLTDSKNQIDFTKISGDGLASCIWELEVIYHERTSWLRNVLKQAQNPSYQAYLEDVYNGFV